MQIVYPLHVGWTKGLDNGHHLQLVPAELLNGEVRLQHDKTQPNDAENAVYEVARENVEFCVD